MQSAYNPTPPDKKIEQAAQLIGKAKFPIVLAGNGVVRQGAAESLRSFVNVLRLPVANTSWRKA